MKEKVYAIVKKMEADGWELISLTSHTTGSGKVLWCAILRKEGLAVNIEIDLERDIWMNGVELMCPKCGRNDGQDLEGDYCPDCEEAWDWEKAIPADYK